MIANLTGILAAKDPSRLVLDVNGVGYEVFIPFSTYFALPDLRAPLTLHVFTHLREDSIQLFGFLTPDEKTAFTLLTKISGVGGKLALSVLSALKIADLRAAILADDLDTLASVPGIGKKSAGRIALELKDKIACLADGAPKASEAPVAFDAPREDALSALVNLGYRHRDVKNALDQVSRTNPAPTSLDELIREGLKLLSKG
ncbi:MAG: Holliday junction branch migration protein RuvA [Nitrospira sp.]|nr:Holliday junction branch migration protein RuvA [Nitrospira sp.]